MKEKIKVIPFIQFICCLMIVFLHSNNLNGFGFDSSESVYNLIVATIETIITTVCQAALPVFFFITGYLFYYKCNWSIKAYIKKIHNRIISLLIPYFIWNLLTVLFYWCISRIPWIATRLNHMYVPNEINFFVNAVITSSFTPLWYVRNIFILALISIILEKILKNKILTVLLILLNMIANLFYEFNYYGLVYWTPIYILGCYCSYQELGLPCIKKKKHLIRSLFCFLILLNVVFNSNVLLYLYRFLSPIVVIDWLQEIYTKKSFTKLVEYSKFTFVIYCSHFLIISIIQKTILLLMGKSWYITFLTYICTPFLCVIIICFIASLIKEYCPSIWKTINGGR